MSKRKKAKRCGFKCRVCKQSLVSDEKLETNHIIPKLLGGEDKYENLELLHASCFKQHQALLDKYGGDKELTKIRKYFEAKNVTPSSTDGIRIMKRQFNLFKYQ